MSSEKILINPDIFARTITSSLVWPEYDQRLRSLLELSVGRVIRKIDNFEYDDNKAALDHIRDWLKASLVNNDPWLSNVDAQGRQKKLLKFSSIEQMVKEADKAMLKAAQKQRNVTLVDGDECFVAELEEGYSVVQLLTPAALDRESGQMQHCIGAGAYDDQLGDEDVRFLSLRDPFGKPHVTMHVVGSFIGELQGKQNQFPARKYIEILKPYLEASCFFLEARASRLGYVIDSNCRWHAVEALPDGLDVLGAADLSLSSLAVLPKDMTVHGTLDISQTAIMELPERLHIEGSLIASPSRLTRLPSDLIVERDIILGSSSIRELPNNLTVNGRLNLCFSHIECLPRGLVVMETLNISDTMITELPDDLKVGRTLVLGDCDIGYIPPSIGNDIEVISDSRRWTVDGFNAAHAVQFPSVA